MAKTIHDVVPPATVKKLPSNDVLIATLFIRGVTIKEIFGRYFEYEEHRSARDDELFGNDEEGQHGAPRLTAGDAEIAGAIPTLPAQPAARQPF